MAVCAHKHPLSSSLLQREVFPEYNIPCPSLPLHLCSQSEGALSLLQNQIRPVWEQWCGPTIGFAATQHMVWGTSQLLPQSHWDIPEGCRPIWALHCTGGHSTLCHGLCVWLSVWECVLQCQKDTKLRFGGWASWFVLWKELCKQ